MKKLLYLFASSLLVFTSCSNNDNNSLDSASSILVKKITETENSLTVSSDVLYDGNKIISKTESDGFQTKFTYSGNQIVKIEEFDAKGLSKGAIEYAYTNGLLTSYVEKYDDLYKHKVKYVHNIDGTVSYEQFKVKISTGIEEKYGQTGKLTFKDGNLIKAERSYSGSDSVEIYEYDGKNNPLKNVTGVNLLLDDDWANTNNVIKETRTSGSGSNIYTDVTSFTYKYDTNNYPIEKVAVFSNSNSTSTETTFYAY